MTEEEAKEAIRNRDSLAGSEDGRRILSKAVGYLEGLEQGRKDVAKLEGQKRRLVAALEMWRKVESEMGNNTPVPDLALRAEYRRKAVRLTKEAIAKIAKEDGEK